MAFICQRWLVVYWSFTHTIQEIRSEIPLNIEEVNLPISLLRDQVLDITVKCCFSFYSRVLSFTFISDSRLLDMPNSVFNDPC